jgi:hemoglobin-like flavoprotein
VSIAILLRRIMRHARRFAPSAGITCLAHSSAVRDSGRQRPPRPNPAGTRLAPIHSTPEWRMTKEDIQLVQDTWRIMEPVKRITAELFYVKLFELDPALRLLFDDDLQLRAGKFMQLMDATVRALDRVDFLLPAVRELGIRNPRFGRSDAHHATIFSALLWTLEKGLRADFTPQVRSAWIKTYGVLSQSMRSAALEAAPQAA